MIQIPCRHTVSKPYGFIARALCDQLMTSATKLSIIQHFSDRFGQLWRRQLDYYFRIDTDSRFHRPHRQDFFDLMARGNYSYAFIRTTRAWRPHARPVRPKACHDVPDRRWPLPRKRLFGPVAVPAAGSLKPLLDQGLRHIAPINCVNNMRHRPGLDVDR